MPSSFPCPSCHAVLKTKADMPAGKKVKCPKCTTIFAVPDEKPAASEERKKQAKPKPLSKSALITEADAICETSQSTYANVRSAEFEAVPNVEYATTLSGISRRGVEPAKR